MSLWTKFRDAVTKPFKKAVQMVAGGLMRGSTPDIQMPAPAVAAPEPVQGQEAAEVAGKKKKAAPKGKRSLMIDAAGSSSSGGATGTGLNL